MRPDPTDQEKKNERNYFRINMCSHKFSGWQVVFTLSLWKSLGNLNSTLKGSEEASKVLCWQFKWCKTVLSSQPLHKADARKHHDLTNTVSILALILSVMSPHFSLNNEPFGHWLFVRYLIIFLWKILPFKKQLTSEKWMFSSVVKHAVNYWI